MKTYATKTLIPYISIKPSYSFTSVYNPDRLTRSSAQVENERNLIENSSGGLISAKARKAIRLSIDWLLICSDRTSLYERSTKKRFNAPLKFITLTLPSPQRHSDAVIKSQCLNQFLIELKQYHHVVNYVWRAESQRNGNIHFHITTDKFIHHRDISEKWNRIIQKLGYIDAYRLNQLQHHSGNFTPRPELFKSWDEEHQRSAYLKGTADNWSSPPTTQIKAVKNLSELGAYLSKEFTKNKIKDIFLSEYRPSNSELDYNRISSFPDLIATDRAKAQITPITSGSNKGLERWDYFVERRPIDGRLWYAGGPCATAKGIFIDLNSEQQTFCTTFAKAHPDKVRPVESKPNANGQVFTLGTLLHTQFATFAQANSSPFSEDASQFISHLKRPRARMSKISQVQGVAPLLSPPLSIAVQSVLDIFSPNSLFSKF